MGESNPIIQLCVQGAHAEFEHRFGDTRALYHQAWELHADGYEACIAAHYFERFQESVKEPYIGIGLH